MPLRKKLWRMSELKKEGKIRAIGLSNFSVEEFKIAMEVDRVDVYQPPFNILWRRMEGWRKISHCIENGISVIPYSYLETYAQRKFSIDWFFQTTIFAKQHSPYFLPENRIKSLGAY